MKVAVVTGPTGVVGSALVRKLIAENYEVYAVCRPESSRMGRLEHKEHTHILSCQLSKLNELPDLISQKVDVFFHLGWMGTTGVYRNDMETQLQNVQYTLDAVNVAVTLGCECFVGVGSQAEYGRVVGMLQPDTPTFPENGYGMAKLCAGQMSRLQCEKYNVRHIWARILSVYGPNDGMQSMIMSVIRDVSNGKSPRLTKGEQIWDYLFADDAANALYLLGEKGVSGRTYCIGSGEKRLLRDYVKIIRDEIDPSVRLGFGEIPYGSNQVMNLWANISTLREDVGFEPVYTFEEGIKKTVEWYRKTI